MNDNPFSSPQYEADTAAGVAMPSRRSRLHMAVIGFLGGGVIGAIVAAISAALIVALFLVVQPPPPSNDSPFNLLRNATIPRLWLETVLIGGFISGMFGSASGAVIGAIIGFLTVTSSQRAGVWRILRIWRPEATISATVRGVAVGACALAGGSIGLLGAILLVAIAETTNYAIWGTAGMALGLVGGGVSGHLLAKGLAWWNTRPAKHHDEHRQ